MKKVVRLTSILVIFIVLFFATQYVNECRQMRDVFNSFVILQDPSEKRNVINETVVTKFSKERSLGFPSPVWTSVEEQYVYSVFSKTEKDGNVVVALAVGPVLSYRLSCSVWFEYENLITSFAGKFLYTSIKWNSTVNIYTFHCRIDEKVKGEATVLVLTRVGSDKKKYTFPIFTEEGTDPRHQTAVCVRPDSVGVGKADIVEFISFHVLVGITHFILYGNDINHKIISKIKSSSNNSIDSLSTLPWNFPYRDEKLQLKLIEMDCSYRTFRVTQAVAVLDWDQYILPGTFKQILDIVTPTGVANSIGFRSQICCLESYDDKRSETSWPIILKKTRCTDYPFDYYFKIHNPKFHEADSIFLNYSSEISLKTFRSCYGLNNLHVKYDHSPLHFLSGLLSSELLRLWNTGSLY